MNSKVDEQIRRRRGKLAFRQAILADYLSNNEFFPNLVLLFFSNGRELTRRVDISHSQYKIDRSLPDLLWNQQGEIFN